MSEPAARRICIAGKVFDLVLREEVRSRARGLGLVGWVRLMEDGTLCAHVEGERSALDEFASSLSSVAAFDSVYDSPVTVEGHEQFAIRGVPAGLFVVQEHQATAHHFDVRLGPARDPSSCTARSCAVASRCSGPVVARSRSGC